MPDSLSWKRWAQISSGDERTVRCRFNVETQLDLCLSTFVVTLKMALPKQRSLHACSLIMFIPLHVCSAGSSCRLGPLDWCSWLLLPDTMGYTVPLHGCVGRDVSWVLPHLGLCCSYLSHCITNTFNARVFFWVLSPSAHTVNEHLITAWLAVSSSSSIRVRRLPSEHSFRASVEKERTRPCYRTPSAMQATRVFISVERPPSTPRVLLRWQLNFWLQPFLSALALTLSHLPCLIICAYQKERLLKEITVVCCKMFFIFLPLLLESIPRLTPSWLVLNQMLCSQITSLANSFLARRKK